MKSNKKQLVIVAGAAGELGTAFCKELTKKSIDCISIIRNKAFPYTSPFIKTITCNLEVEQEVEEKFSEVEFDNYDEIIYLHTIGIDKFDPRGYPTIHAMSTIDPHVYNTNVNSFKYLMRFCIRKIRDINTTTNKKVHFKIAIVAGVADKYAPFVIESFCEAKYIVRQYIQSQVNLYPDWVSGLSINITSTILESALNVRPNADTTYWFCAQDISEQSIDTLLENENGYKEIELIKKSPEFTEGYYENKELLYKKWSKETGIT